MLYNRATHTPRSKSSITWINTAHSLARFLDYTLYLAYFATKQVTKAIIQPCCRRSIEIVGTKTLESTSFSLYTHS